MLCVRCLAMGFHVSKARLDGQFLPVQASRPKRRLDNLNAYCAAHEKS